MDKILASLGAFAASKDSRLACAAAVVLAELAPHEPEIVRELVAGLDHADPVRRPFLIEALGRIGTPEAAAALVPLIKAEGPAREQALRAIAHTASAALKPLLALVGRVPPDLLERIAECVSRTGERAAFASLLNTLSAADIEVCRAIRAGIRSALPAFDERAREHLRVELERAFQTQGRDTQPTARIALLKISGDTGDPAFLPCALEAIESAQPPHVRRVALQTIGVLKMAPEQRGKLAGRILPLLQEGDLANLAEPACEALREAHLGSEHQASLRKLVNSPSARIREFAMAALARLGTARTLAELLTCLDSPDRSLREEALAALGGVSAAAGPLSERLLATPGGELAGQIARALAAQAAAIPKKVLEALAEQYVGLTTHKPLKPLGAEEKQHAILQVFRAANSPLLAETILAQARKLRGKAQPQWARELLRAVLGLPGWNDECRLELALAGLQASPIDLSRTARLSDSNLRELDEVLSAGRLAAPDLARRILKDAGLERKTIYYLGFHFVERLHAQREFGQALLRKLAESHGAEGKQAKEKLLVEGLLTGKTRLGILEERAKVMLAPSEVAALAPAPAKRKPKAKAKGNAEAKTGKKKKK